MVGHEPYDRDRAEGFWRKDVISILNKAIRITDMSVVDGLTSSPNRYLMGVIDKIKSEKKKPTSHELRNERNRYWSDSLALFQKNLSEAKSQGDEFGTQMLSSIIAQCQAKIEATS